MDEYHRNLIAAFADGSLDDDETRLVEALLADDEEARRELAAHRVALDALRSAPTPALTESERERLHDELMAQLNLETAAVVDTAPKRPRFSWAAIAVAAAALVGVVAAAPLLNLLTTGAGDTATEPVALPTTTTAASRLFSDAEQSAGVDAPPTAEAPDRTRFDAATSTTVLQSAAAAEFVPDLGEVADEDLQDLESVWVTAGSTDFAAYVRDDTGAPLVPLSEIESVYAASGRGLFAPDQQCADELATVVAGPAARELVAVAELEGRPVAVLLIQPTDDDLGSALVTIDIETCEILSQAL